MNCCVRRQVEVGGSYEPLGVAGLILIDRNIPDLGPMLQKDFDHVQRAALTVGRRAILQRLASDAIDDAVVAVRHLEKAHHQRHHGRRRYSGATALRTSFPASGDPRADARTLPHGRLAIAL